MSELEEKLSAVLNNPNLMQQILAVAQSMEGSSSPENNTQESVHESSPCPQADLQQLQSILGQGNIDRDQEALLHALSPFLSNHRVQKLKRAMQAARIAGTASRFLSAGGLQMLTGR